MKLTELQLCILGSQLAISVTGGRHIVRPCGSRVMLGGSDIFVQTTSRFEFVLYICCVALDVECCWPGSYQYAYEAIIHSRRYLLHIFFKLFTLALP